MQIPGRLIGGNRLAVRSPRGTIQSQHQLVCPRVHMKVLTRFALFVLLVLPLCAADDATPAVPLTVPAGTPLRLYLSHKIPKHTGAAVEAKVLEPVYAFDREVIPAGSVVVGRVSRLQPVSKMRRASAILGGDFTPLRSAFVDFASVKLPDGRRVALQTDASEGLQSIVPLNSPKPKKQKAASPNQSTGVLGTGKQKVQEQINSQINSRTYGLGGLVRGPNKKERLEDFLWAKLPYHPQSLRVGTRFDAMLKNDLSFGTAPVETEAMASLGTQPPPDSVVRARLLTPLDSGITATGSPVEAVLAAPLFSPDHQLILPEGTRLTGAVVMARKARYFHRGGQLRFNFQRIDLPAAAAALTPADKQDGGEFRTQAQLGAAESVGKAVLKVDNEGGVKATESKTRLVAPVISVLIANKSLDNDAGRRSTSGATDANVSGRTLGGLSGFGMAGSLAAQSSKYVGTAFGLYGMGLSVYSNVIARGSEVEFGKNALIEIKFGARPPAGASKLQAGYRR